MAGELVVANEVLFSEFCTILESIYKRKKQKDRKEQERVLIAFVNDFRIRAANINGKKNSSFFPILRLLLPEKERERPAYNLKENKLGALLVKVLSLSKNSPDANKLQHFRSVQSTQDSDFGGIAYFVLKNRLGNNSGSLNIGEINNILDKIATAEVGNKNPILDEAFSYVLKNLSAEQIKWFIRIILKDLKIGMGSHRILAAFHPDAPDLFDTLGNLSKVCEELEDGDTRPLEMGIKVFFAVSPMLSERLNVTRASQELPADRQYIIENKFDGERFQLHMENGVFEYFSRKGYTYSEFYGKTYHDSGVLTPLLKDCFSPSVNSVILDGEMMGWHKYNNYFGSKGMAFDVKKITENSRFRPCFCVFDILYLNGKSLVGPPDKGGLPLAKRLDILKNLFTDKEGVIMHSTISIVKSVDDILEALNKAIEDQEEGIVVKERESYYIPNKRNAGWYKIKPEVVVTCQHILCPYLADVQHVHERLKKITKTSEESTMSDLDVVIIGADEAENKRQGRARSFHVACADVIASGDMPHRYLDIGKVATGLAYEERERICALIEKKWVAWKKSPPPSSLVFDKAKPDYWVNPEHSVVVQVRASELIRSTDFATDYTLRFPRIVAVRDDKPVQDILTLKQFEGLVAERTPVVKLSKRRVNQEQIDGLDVPRRKRTAKAPQVAEQFRTKVPGDVVVTSQALAGRKIHILTDDEDCKKPELVRIVESHGGKHVENVGSDTWCCVVGRLNLHARTLIKAQELDIISTSWLRSLPNSDTPCSLSPLGMLSIKNETKLKLSRHFDKFGDSYTEEIDVDTLKKCFQKMENEEPEIYLTNAEMLELDKELFGDHNPFSYLRPFYLHFAHKNDLIEMKAKMFGANVCDIESPKLTHVLITDVENIDEISKKIKKSAVIVYTKWLEKCFDEDRLVEESEFLL